MGRGSSNGRPGAGGGGGSAYNQVANYIRDNGIPTSFMNLGNETTKEIFRAISDYGTLNSEEQKIYNRISMPEPGRIYYQGSSRDVEGYTAQEIDGAKKFMAHSYFKRVGRAY